MRDWPLAEEWVEQARFILGAKWSDPVPDEEIAKFADEHLLFHQREAVLKLLK